MSKIIKTDNNKENINYPNNSSWKNRYDKGKMNQSLTSLNSSVNNNIALNKSNLKERRANGNSNYYRNNNSHNNSVIEKDKKFITINDIIGERCPINLDILRYFYSNYEQSKVSKKALGIIKSYAANTYQGIVRNYNEDRVSIIINVNKPDGYYKKNWPKISFFGIYDGHGGEGCSEYLKDNLHKLICYNNKFFPENIPEAIKLAFQKAENDFINNYALNDKKEIIDRSGSCAVIILMVDNKIYVANVGDSRCILSMKNGKKYVEATKDHKPNFPNEIKRISKYGGNIYQTETVINNINNPKINGKVLIGPYRVLPGRLSVSRTVGDVEAKYERFGGNPNVIIAEPEITTYDLNRNDIDFFILGCDGIYDQMESNEVLDCAWTVINEKEHLLVKQCKDIHQQSGIIVDYIMKSALARKSFDNVTCLFIALKELGDKFNENKEIKEKNEKRFKTEYTSPKISSHIKPAQLKDIEKFSLMGRKSYVSLNNPENNPIDDKTPTNNNNNNIYFSKREGSINSKYQSNIKGNKINNSSIVYSNSDSKNKKDIQNLNISPHNRIHIQTTTIDYQKRNEPVSKINTYYTYSNINNNSNSALKIQPRTLINRSNIILKEKENGKHSINNNNSTSNYLTRQLPSATNKNQASKRNNRVSLHNSNTDISITPNNKYSMLNQTDKKNITFSSIRNCYKYMKQKDKDQNSTEADNKNYSNNNIYFSQNDKNNQVKEIKELSLNTSINNGLYKNRISLRPSPHQSLTANSTIKLEDEKSFSKKNTKYSNLILAKSKNSNNNINNNNISKNYSNNNIYYSKENNQSLENKIDTPIQHPNNGREIKYINNNPEKKESRYSYYRNKKQKEE